jgi:enoyl-CoA hydratase
VVEKNMQVPEYFEEKRLEGEMPEDPVLLTIQGSVATITLNRPNQRTAVSPEMAEMMEGILDRIEEDDNVRASVLAANTDGQPRPVFCAGADAKALAQGRGKGLRTERGHFGGFVFRERTKPIIAAVDGMAIAGGCEFVLACDFAVATRRSTFALFEVKRNLIAGGGSLFRLPRAVGRATALDMLLTAEILPAERAFQLGLVSRLVDEGEALNEAKRAAEAIAANGPIAVQQTRRFVMASEELSDIEVRRLTDAAIQEIHKTNDTREGLMAFLENRAPNWTAS